MIFYMGLAIFAVALVYTGFLVVYRIFFAQPLSGWTSVMASIWLLGGLIISFIGIVGIYLSKTYSEAKQRPFTIVRAIHQNASVPAETPQRLRIEKEEPL
jgi:putative glycosyltransferase